MSLDSPEGLPSAFRLTLATLTVADCTDVRVFAVRANDLVCKGIGRVCTICQPVGVGSLHDVPEREVNTALRRHDDGLPGDGTTALI